MMELEKCPYCGGEAHIITIKYGLYKQTTTQAASCDVCKATGPRYDPDGEKWNAVARAVTERDEARHWSAAWKQAAKKWFFDAGVYSELDFDNLILSAQVSELAILVDEARRWARKMKAERDDARISYSRLMIEYLSFINKLKPMLDNILARTRGRQP
jgi:hypothetical protein